MDITKLPEPYGWVYDGPPSGRNFHRSPVDLIKRISAPVFSAPQMAEHAALVAAEAVEKEREACAAACDPYVNSTNDRVSLTALNILGAIRARSTR